MSKTKVKSKGAVLADAFWPLSRTATESYMKVWRVNDYRPTTELSQWAWQRMRDAYGDGFQAGFLAGFHNGLNEQEDDQ